MTQGWMVEVEARDDYGDLVSQSYVANLEEAYDAHGAVLKFLDTSDPDAEDDLSVSSTAAKKKDQNPKIFSIRIVGPVSEAGLAFLDVQPGKVARWA